MLLASLPVPGHSQAGSARRDPREVLQRAVQAMGGSSALANISTLHATGTVEVLGGYVGPYESWAKAPNQLRTHWDIGLVRHDLGFDGRTGWERQLTVRELPEMDRMRVERRALFLPLVAYLAGRTPVRMGRQGEHVAAADSAGITVVVSPPNGLEEIFVFDSMSYLPLREIRKTRYEEGMVDLTVRYGDWRRVGTVMLPFAIDEALLELPLSIRIGEYRLNEAVADSMFLNPQRSFRTPLAVSLATIPKRIYKEVDVHEGDRWRRFWGIPFTPTENWLVNVLVREQHGRYVKPKGVTIEFFAGTTLIKTQTLTERSLAPITKYPVARFYPQDEVYHLRHWFSEAVPLGIDRMRYTLRYESRSGKPGTATVDIPVSRYQSRTPLIAPIKGPFVAMGGHEYYEVHHKYEWSQQFAYDFVGLGPGFELRRGSGESLEEKVTFGRDLVAPGDGVVSYARNDVPDLMLPKQYLKLRDPQWAIGGNSVVIDHGNGEFSAVFHMREGSVQVKTGDRVKQGQVIGRIGSSGSPGSPHLHYQLQDGPLLFGADGLPVRFTNLEAIGMGRDRSQVETPIRGVYLWAR